MQIIDLESDRKKLAIITPGFYEQAIGGAEYQSYLFASAAKEFGYQVYYIFIAIDSTIRITNNLGINLFPIYSPRYRRYLRGIGNTAITCIPDTWKTLKEINPDYIYCRSGVIQAGLGAYYAKKFNKKSIWQVASLTDVMPQGFLSLIRRPLDFLERLSIRYAIKRSTYVLTQAEYQSKLLKENFARSSIILRNLIPEAFETGTKNENFTIVWIANIKPLKKPETFMQLAEVLSDIKNIRFIMIGKPAMGKYQEALEYKIAAIKNLRYLGLQTMADVNMILAKAHLLVNTSVYEGFSNTFIQAWIRGVPVVSLTVNPDNLLNKFNIGYFSGTFDNMVSDVLRLYSNKTLLRKMSQNARNYAIKYHSFEKNKNQIYKILCESTD
jgi:glycosyltransferase involved in cell wall biosynthesis